MRHPLSDHSRLVATKEFTSCEFDGETIMLNTRNGEYYGLSEVASVAWEFIQQPKTLAEIHEAVLARFDVTAEQCDADLRAWLRDMLEEGLVEIKEDAG